MRITHEDSGLLVVKDTALLGYIVGLLFVILGATLIVAPEIISTADQAPPPLWLSVIFVVMGLLTIFLTSTIVVRFDKGMQKVYIVRKRITGKKEEEYEWNQIKELQLQKEVDQSSTRSRRRKLTRSYLYQLVLILKDEKQIMLNNATNRKILIGEKIAGFLGVPFSEKQPPTLREAYSAIQDAIQKGNTTKNQK